MYVPARRRVSFWPAPMSGRAAKSRSRPLTFALKRFDVVWTMPMIGPTPEALPSGGPRKMKLENVCALAALARMVVTGSPPITIEVLMKIENTSTPIYTCLVGSKTMPSVVERDFSGLRLGLPPVIVGNWLLQSPGAPVVTLGQLIGSRVPLAVTLVACAVYKSVS